MKAVLKKDAKHVYLVFEDEEEYNEDYRFHMLLSNHIPGILPCNVRSVDEKARFYYEVTGKRSLRKVLTEDRASKALALKLLSGIVSVQEVCSDYLLDMRNIILLPEYIYMDDTKVYFCYFPLWDSSPEKAFHVLAENMLRVIDPTDHSTVQFMYLLLHLTEDDYRFAEVMDQVSQNSSGFGRHRLFEEPETEYQKPEDIGAAYGKPEKKPAFKKLFSRLRRGQNPEEDDDFYEDPATTLLGYSESEELLLCPLSGADTITVSESPYIIGADRGGERTGIHNSAVSRTHAQLTKLAGSWFLEDLHSTNGTFHNGQQIVPGERIELSPEDEVTFANESYRVSF